MARRLPDNMRSRSIRLFGFEPLGNIVILTRTETCVQLTYTLDEYKEFNHVIVAFRNEITTTLRNETRDLQDDDKEYFSLLADKLVHALDYIDRTMVCSRTETGMRLTFIIDEYDKFNENIGLLRMDLCGFQEFHNHRGEYEKEDALENIEDLIDVFVRLLGNRMIVDS